MSKQYRSETEQKSQETPTQASGHSGNSSMSNSYILSVLGLSGPDIPEKELDIARPLVEQYGEDLVSGWLKTLLTKWVESPDTAHAIDTLTKVGGYIKGTQKIIAAFDAVQSTNASSSPGQKLMELHALFDLVSLFLPDTPVTSVFNSWIDAYLKTIEVFAAALDQTADLLCKQERKRFGGEEHDLTASTANPAKFDGGHALHDYLYETLIINDGQAAIPSSDVISWVMRRRDALKIITKEAPPAKQNEFLGIDYLALDEVDEEALADYFTHHANEIKQAVYGGVELSRAHYLDQALQSGGDE